MDPARKGNQAMTIEIRPACAGDLPLLERRCWSGGEAELRRRIAAQGTCAVVALDGGRPVAQVGLRRFAPAFRSPAALHDGSWWADLAGGPEVPFPHRTALLGCWHVGRLRDSDGREYEEPSYRGRGIGTALLDAAVAWLRSGDAPFDALAVKAADDDSPAYLGWLGGLPRPLFEQRGFVPIATYDDPYLRGEPGAVPAPARTDHWARVHLMLLTR
jgi:GNAT superfamily N-acetyltransferase